VTRIPRNKSELHVQRIIESHYLGALICLSEPRGRKKKTHFTNGHLTIPQTIVDQHPALQRAMDSDEGVAITPTPLPKLYLRPLTAKKSNDVDSLKQQIMQLAEMNHKLKEEMYMMRQKHEAEIMMLRVDFEESQTEVRELISQVASHVVRISGDDDSNQLNLFSPPRKRHPKSSPPHKR